MLRRFLCRLFGHNWTCNAEQGIPPQQWMIDRGVNGFFHYAMPWCLRCNHIMRFTSKVWGDSDRSEAARKSYADWISS